MHTHRSQDNGRRPLNTDIVKQDNLRRSYAYRYDQLMLESKTSLSQLGMPRQVDPRNHSRIIPPLVPCKTLKTLGPIHWLHRHLDRRHQRVNAGPDSAGGSGSRSGIWGQRRKGQLDSTTVEPGFPGISCSCKVKNSMLEHGDIDGDIFVYLELVAGREGAGLFCCMGCSSSLER